MRSRWIVGILVVWLGLGVVATPALAQEEADPLPEGAEEVYRFENEEEMQGFGQLYNAKQAILARLGVLTTYAAMEQSNLQTVDQRLSDEYGMDPNKPYTLDTDQFVLYELPLPEEAQQAAPVPD